jgi:poly-gamma-glutamate synthesis protein (capsule biosynthesis protein)
MRLFPCGDVMTGRGIEQILRAPCDPAIDEPWMKSAQDYVALGTDAIADRILAANHLETSP